MVVLKFKLYCTTYCQAKLFLNFHCINEDVSHPILYHFNFMIFISFNFVVVMCVSHRLKLNKLNELVESFYILVN